MIKEVPVAKASLEDINKALRSKPILTEDSVRNRLPEQVKEFAHLFTDGKSAEDLPRLQGSSDHAINPKKKEDGKIETPPWGPLYNMSREELLVLRKTLTDLLRKDGSNQVIQQPLHQFFLPRNQMADFVCVLTTED